MFVKYAHSPRRLIRETGRRSSRIVIVGAARGVSPVRPHAASARERRITQCQRSPPPGTRGSPRLDAATEMTSGLRVMAPRLLSLIRWSAGRFRLRRGEPDAVPLRWKNSYSSSRSPSSESADRRRRELRDAQVTQLVVGERGGPEQLPSSSLISSHRFCVTAPPGCRILKKTARARVRQVCRNWTEGDSRYPSSGRVHGRAVVGRAGPSDWPVQSRASPRPVHGERTGQLPG